MPKKKTIDIVLPCYNPLEDWAETVVENFLALREQVEHELHLIIVNDGSTSGITDEKVSFIRNKVDSFLWIDQQPNKGKGAALRTGMAQSKAELSLFTDIDFPYTTPSTLNLIETLASGQADIAVGQRKKRYYEKTPWQRKMVSKMLKSFNKHILKIPVTDTQVGLKGFNRKGLDAFMKTTVNRYLFDLEFLIIASRKKEDLNIHPVGVELRDNVIFTKLNLKLLLPEFKNIAKLFFTAWRQ